MEELFDRAFGAANGNTQAQTVLTMPVDVTEREGKLLITAAVPGIDPNELEVSIENNVLNIRGESRHQAESNETKVYRREIRYGRVSRSIRLPEGLDLNAVDAEFKNGHVTISLSRLPEEKPKALRVNVRNAEGAKPLEANAESTENSQA
jgi:HSP20 family protein